MLKGYVNKTSNSNRIFSREEIGKMTKGEFAENEKAIDYQVAKIGAPSNKELASSEEVVHVKAYSRGDGVHVKEHFRSKPDGSFDSNSPEEPQGGFIPQPAPDGPVIDENPTPEEQIAKALKDVEKLEEIAQAIASILPNKVGKYTQGVIKYGADLMKNKIRTAEIYSDPERFREYTMIW